jgi:5-methylcytosine-specific restriction protein A
MSSSSPWRYLYNSTRWIKGRLLHLAKHPLCEYCKKRGIVKAAKVVDHKTPHRGDEQLFFDESNWQSLCKECHDSVKQAEEHGRLVLGTDADGNPIDVNHPWNTGGRDATRG